MKKDLTEAVAGLRQGLQALLEKGFYEEVKKVGSWDVTMHILTDKEESEVANYLKNLDIVTREKTRPTIYLAHAVSSVAGIAFESLEEAVKFFGLLTPILREGFVLAYNEMVPKNELQVKALLGEIKNSSEPAKVAVTGS